MGVPSHFHTSPSELSTSRSLSHSTHRAASVRSSHSNAPPRWSFSLASVTTRASPSFILERSRRLTFHSQQTPLKLSQRSTRTRRQTSTQQSSMLPLTPFELLQRREATRLNVAS